MEYQLVAQVTISVYTKVEAESPEQAIEIAESRSMMEIPPNSGYGEDEFWVAEELDGSPKFIRIEE